nr:hypothetical protein Iba_chr13fCG2880 [Ipomoea batatas]
MIDKSVQRLKFTVFFKVASAAMTQAAETLAIKVPKGTHFNEPDFPKPRPFNRAKNHLIQTPNDPTRQASHSWALLLPLLNSCASSAIHVLHRAPRISSNAAETTKWRLKLLIFQELSELEFLLSEIIRNCKTTVFTGKQTFGPIGSSNVAFQSWQGTEQLHDEDFVNASVDTGDTISRIDGDTGETLFVATGSWKQRPSSEMGTTIPLSAALSADKASLPLPLYLLLQSALSPISPASDTDSLPSSFSSCSEKENDKLRELLCIEQELLVLAKDPLLLSSDSLFPWSMVAFLKLLDLQLLQLKIYCSFNQQDGMTIRIMEVGAF